MIEGNPLFRNYKEKTKRDVIDKRVLEIVEISYSSKFSVYTKDFCSKVKHWKQIWTSKHLISFIFYSF